MEAIEPGDRQGAFLYSTPWAKYTSATFPITTGSPAVPDGTIVGWQFDPPTMSYTTGSTGDYHYYNRGSYRIYTYSGTTSSWWGRWDNRLSELVRVGSTVVIADKEGAEYVFNDPYSAGNGRLTMVKPGGASRIEYVYGHTGSKLSAIWHYSGTAASYNRLMLYEEWNSYGPTVIQEYLRKEGEIALASQDFEESEWALLRTITFQWWQSGWADGTTGHLMGIDVEDELSRSGEKSLARTVFRYYSPSQLIKAVMGPESYRDYEVTHNPATSTEVFEETLTFLNGTSPTGRNYIDQEIGYWGSSDFAKHRIRSRTFRNESCGCSGSSAGTFWYSYAFATSSPLNFNTWYLEVSVKKGAVESTATQYAYFLYNTYGKKLVQAIVDPNNTSNEQVRAWSYNTTTAALTWEYLPSACSGYNPSSKSAAILSLDGLVYEHEFSTSEYPSAKYFRKGASGARTQLWGQTLTKYPDSTGTGKRKRWFLTSRTEYFSGTKIGTTSIGYPEFYNSFDALAPKLVTTTLPTVAIADNGSGATATSRVYMDLDGRVLWSKDASGAVTFTEYFTYANQVKRRVVDVNTGTGSGQINPPHTDFSQSFTRSSSWPNGGSPLHLATVYEIEPTGRIQKVTDPSGRTRRFQTTLLGKGELVELEFPHLGASAGTDGAILITVSYQGGSVRHSAVATPQDDIHAGDIEDSNHWTRFWEESESNVVDALHDEATLTNRTEQVYENGHLMATRRYIIAMDPEPSGNVLETTFGYDDRGNRNKVKDPSGTGGGTITRSTFDFLGRLIKVEVGTNDSGGGGDNMVEVEARAYDGATVGGSPSLGDGRLTKVVQKPGGGASNRETTYEYDFAQEGRRVKTTSPSGIIERVTNDRQGNVTDVKVYGTGGESSGNLRAWHEYSFDSRGQLFQERLNAVNPSSGATGSSDYALLRYWRSERGEVAKVLENGYVLRKSQFDGAGRVARSTVSHDSAESTWSAALNLDLATDTVIEQSETLYDAAGNAIIQKRLDRAPGYGSTGLLTYGNPAVARGDFTVFWYDNENRRIATGYYGDNGFSSNLTSQPSQPSTSSFTVLITTWTYYSDGDVEKTTDPQGVVTKYEHDDLGRLVKKTENEAETGVWSDRITEYTHTVTDAIATITATTAGPGGGSGYVPQTTTYHYGATNGTDGSVITSNRLVHEIDYPQDDSSVERDTFGYNALGEVIRKEDPAGNVHVYLYNLEGDLSADKATVIVSPFDDVVKSIGQTFDDLGRLKKLTSYPNNDLTGTALNEVEFSYEKYGLPALLKQNPLGAVGGGSTSRTITNNYSYPWNGTGPLRRSSVQYPSGLVILETYGSSGSDNDRLSRLHGREASTGSVTLFQNTYQGLSRVLTRSHPQPQVDWKVTLDRFSRVSTLKAIYMPYTYNHNNYEYGYNYNGQVTYRKELTTSGQSEEYGYNGLSMLNLHERGTHDSSGAIPSPDYIQSWQQTTTPSLDHSGNWRNYIIYPPSTTPFARTVNKSNEVTEIDPPSGTTEAIGYDASGNAITNGGGLTYRYDAWNRLVEVKLGSTTSLLNLRYNGLNQKVKKGQYLDTGKLYYYNDAWQVLQEYDGMSTGTGLFSYVWGAQYMDELVARRTESTSTWQYYIQDANFNVVSRISASGSVQYRYTYTAYGVPTQINSAWTTPTDLTEDLRLFTGQDYHYAAGMYDYRNRTYHPTWGRFVQRDPIGVWGDQYAFGNGYAYAAIDPVNAMDPFGDACVSVSAKEEPKANNTLPALGRTELGNVESTEISLEADCTDKPACVCEAESITVVVPFIISINERQLKKGQYWDPNAPYQGPWPHSKNGGIKLDRESVLAHEREHIKHVVEYMQKHLNEVKPSFCDERMSCRCKPNSKEMDWEGCRDNLKKHLRKRIIANLSASWAKFTALGNHGKMGKNMLDSEKKARDAQAKELKDRPKTKM